MTSSAPPPKRLRALLLVLGLPLLVLGVLTTAVLWRLDSRARKEARAVATEYRALRGARYPRPSQVEHPTPGTFAQALEPLLPALRDAAASQEGQDLEMDLGECWDFIRDGRLETPLAETCRERLQRFAPLMHQVLRASRTEEAGLPEELHLASVPGLGRGWRLERTVHGLVSLAALEARLQVSRGQADPGWELCLDALALSRDLSLGSGESGALSGTHDLDVLFPPCAATLAGLSSSSLSQATVALRHLREGLRPLSAALEESRVLDPLRDTFQLLDAEEARGLPPFDLHPVTTGGFVFQRRTFWGIEPFLMRDAFLAQREDQRRLIPLVDRPLELRMPPLERLGREERDSRNPRRATVALDAIQAAVRVDRQRLEVDVLLALALVRLYRAEHGQWPSTLPSLYPEHPVVRPTSVRMHPGTGDTLVLEPEEAQVQALIEFIDPQEREGALTSFQVTAPP